VSLLDFSEVDDTSGAEVGVDIFADGKANLVSSCGRGGIEIWTFDLWKEGKGKV
jgi:hypothetical protein